MQRFLEQTIYYAQESPPRTRDPSRPMQVICPGFPRCGTESLQLALIKLGYDYTYHGWDVIFEQPTYIQAWAALARRKFRGDSSGDSNITNADFDALLGHSVAVTDAPASVFASDMIRAYPNAKVILNGRPDLDAWHVSAINNLVVPIHDSPKLWLTSWWTWYGFWSWTVYHHARYGLWPLLFRAGDDGLGPAIRRNGKWIYREHYDMVRGMVPKDNLLEWCVDDGWEPLCKFLDKPVPNEPFPEANNTAAFAERIQQWLAKNDAAFRRNVSTFVAVVAIGVGITTWRFAPNRLASAAFILMQKSSLIIDTVRGTLRR